MTDKQIIIDGIDVSGCKYYDDLDCYAERDSCGYPLDCKDNPKCYYKQLTRKKQECEELNDLANHNGRVCNERLDKLDELEHDINELNEQLDQLKAENEELQYQLRCVTGREKEYRKNSDFWEKRHDKLKEQFFQLRVENDLYKNAHKTEQDRRRSYENALAEIKEIAEPFCETCQKFEPEKKDRNNIYCRFCNYGKILQKISEVLKND